MNKGELIEAAASKSEESKATAGRVLDAILDCIVEGVKTDDSVSIPGFGTFSKRERAARQGRNPATGEPMQIAASTSMGFKPSKNVKEAL